jgi:hypothetical protein
MRRNIVLSSFISSMVAVVTLLVAQHLVQPGRVAAQGDQPQEIRASKFTLVAADGTVIGTWESRPSQQVTRGGISATTQGGARLSIFNAAGKQRVALAPDGLLAVYDADGTTPRFISGYVLPANLPGPTGNAPLNGLQLDAAATIDYSLGSP